MLRVVAHKSAAAARNYYAEGLKREDYYSEGQEVAGKWNGKAAKMLGLSRGVTPEAFAALVENRHPETGVKLTPRMKGERVVGYDLNFHAPKSLSILHALTGDENIVKAFRASVAETMAEIEEQISTRVRKGGAQANRVTGNFAWAEFIHFTARPVGGIPDPHLHVHCFAFNVTHDAEEGRWKAANFREAKKDAPYSEAVFHSRLTDKLKEFGYGIERTRMGWEISGISRTLIDKFSRRTAQIERLAEEKGIRNPKDLDALGAASREGKRHGLKYTDLLAAWGVRLTPEEKVLISKVCYDKEGQRQGEKVTAAKAVDEAAEKVFAKNSVVEVKRLVAEALRFGVGQVTTEQAWTEFDRRQMVVRNVKGELLCTSLDVLAEEVWLIHTVRNGRGMHAPLKSGKLRFANENLSEEQMAAVRHILTSRDQVIGVRGLAGVGKTTAMSEAVRQIEETGRRVYAFAPSASASREKLREDGFANAETVAHLLHNKKLQQEIRGQVIWVDEAGLVGMHDMAEIMKIAGSSTPVILTGDTGQHAPVPRGDPFRIIQEYAGLRVVELKEIRRQEREDYRKAVAALSKGDLRTAFHRLDEIGAIIEVADDEARYRLLAQDFLELSRKGTVPLVVSPTHAEGAKATAAIRDAMREAGKLGPERSFSQYHNLRWEAPDRRRPENYQQGLLVQFHQNALGIKRGEMFRVVGRNELGEVQIQNERARLSLPLKSAEHFQVFEERLISLARGDRIRITLGGKSENGRRLNNGNVFTIEKFSRDGKIVLNNGAVLDPEHGHLTHGYCQTSHSSQSKTVRHVLVAQSADSFLASSREQFYVSVSRGKESIRIYTDDRRELQQAVGNSSTRRAGVELAGISAKDIAAMSDELNGRQWHERVRSRRGTEATVSEVKTLLQARKQPGTSKSNNFDFRQYVAMRRGLVGADGRNCSKGIPGTGGRSNWTDPKRGPDYAWSKKPQAVKTPANENRKPSAKAKPMEVTPRQGRLAKGYEAAKSHFKKAVGRVKDAAKSIRSKRTAKQWPASNAETNSKHKVKQQAAEAVAKSKKQTKTQTKAPTPPGPRGGR